MKARGLGNIVLSLSKAWPYLLSLSQPKIPS